MTRAEILLEGCQVLEPILGASGFVFVTGPSGHSSGGDYASGQYVKEDRSLELHVRHSLGLVTYHIGDLSLTHEAYMRALLGRKRGNKYPGFSDDPLDGFRALRFDLEHYCSDFLSGSGEEFRGCVAAAKEREKLSGFKRLNVE